MISHLRQPINYCTSLTTPLVCIYLTELHCTSTVNILISPKFTEKRKSEAHCSSALSMKLSMTLLELSLWFDLMYYSTSFEIFFLFFCFKQITVRCHEAFQRSSELLQDGRYYWSCSALCRHEETILKCIFCQADLPKKKKITDVLYIEKC